MRCFKAELKKIYTNKIVLGMLGGMIAVAIIDPLFIYYVNGSRSSFFETIGAHPFQFWLLINSSSWGHAIYYMLFFLFPIISTGFVYYHEQSTSIMEFLMVKTTRKRYLSTKVGAVFCSTFINFLAILGINLLITFLRFDVDAPKTGQYAYNVPKVESFAFYFYQISPLLMAIFYSVFNAFIQALMATLMLGLQMLFRFKKIYTAAVIPFIVIYLMNYLTEIIGLKTGYMRYCILYLVQPKAAAALITPITGDVLAVTVSVIILCTFICVILGIKRNENIL